MNLINTRHGKVLIMNFVNAEHCGMNSDELDFEADVSGIDMNKENPIAILIQYDGGMVVTPKTSYSTRRKMHEATKRFIALAKDLEVKP